MAVNSVPPMSKYVVMMGYWSAIISGILALGSLAAMVIQTVTSPSEPWSGIQAMAQGFSPIEMLKRAPSLPLALTFLLMMVSVYFYASERNKVWAIIGINFSILNGFTASINYLHQLLVNSFGQALREPRGLYIFEQVKPGSVFFALGNSYGYMSLAMLFAAWAFASGRPERWARWVLVAVGITAPFQFIDVHFALGPIIGPAMGLFWSIGTPVACFLIAFSFKRAERFRKTQ